MASDWMKRVMQAASVAVAGLGVAVLIGWQTHQVALIQVVPTLAPMQRMTALGFLLSGSALFLASIGRRRASAVCALIVLVQAVLVLLEYALGADFGLDQLLGRAYITVHTSHAGRMSPITALCFIGGSVAVPSGASRKLSRYASAIRGVVASMLIAVGAISVPGHLFGHAEVYGVGRLTSMALHTGAAFAILGAGLLAWAWRLSGEKKGAPAWLPLSIGLALVVAIIGVWQILRKHEAADLPLISAIILAGGLLGALLVAVSVAQAQQARKRNRELQASNQMFQQLFDVAPDGLLMTDQKGLIVRANEQVEKIFGYSQGELLGLPVEKLIPEGLRDAHRTHRKGYYSASSTRAMGQGLELLALRKDAREFPVEIALTPLQTPAREMMVVAVVRDITEHQQAQETLRLSEERFRSVFEQGPIGVVLIGMDRRMIKVNSAFCRMLGYTETELAGMTPLDITHPEDRGESANLIQGILQGSFPSGKVDKRYVKKNGDVIWGSLTASVIRDQEGQPLYSVGIIEDITERKRAEAELRLGNEIIANMEEGLCLIRVSDGVIVHANPKFEKMFAYGRDELVGKYVAALNAPTDKSPEEVARHIIAELMHNPAWRGEVLNCKKDGTPFWSTVTVSTFDHPDFGKVWVSVHQDITELKKAQETLRESEERFRSIFEQGPIGVALLGTDHRMTKTNPAFCQMLGYSEAELATMTPIDMTHPDDREYCTGLLQRLDRGEIPVCRMEKRYRKKNGEFMWASLTASVIRDNQGRPLCGLGMVEDVTERRRAQQKLTEQAVLLDLANDAIGARDLEGKIIFWSRGAEQSYGWSAKEALGSVAHELLQSRYPVPLKEIETTVLKLGGWEGEVEQTTRDGRTIVVDSRWSLWRDEQGTPKAFLVINRDITTRKQAEEQLRILTERLSLATRTASIGIWDRDLRTNRVVWDDTLFEIFGMPKAVPIAYEEFARRVHPDDLARVEASVERTIKNKVQDFMDFRIIRPDGSVRYVSSAQGAVLDEHGNVVRLVGTGVDITERKEAEENLRSLTERLSLATRTSSIGIWDWDLRTNQVVWDDTLFEIFGIPRMVPMPYQEFSKCVHLDDLAKVEESLRRAIEGMTQAFVEFRIIRPDGAIRHVYAAQGAVRDEKGNAVRVVGTGVDITERKRMEAQIEANKTQLVASARLSALGMMAGGVAHEINNPVGIIHALASDLLDVVKEEGGVPPQMVERNSSRIRETADRIARIIKSMRQISREGAADKFHPTRVGKMVEETLEICRERFRANAVKLLLPREMPELTVSCREVQIAQILLNLLQNAFDAVAEQPGERWVRLDVSPSDDSVVIAVTDSGPGVPAELRPHLMEPFFTTKPVGKGTGLGLSLSRTIAEEHGGRLEYSEDQGHTQFSLVLPLTRQEETVWS